MVRAAVFLALVSLAGLAAAQPGQPKARPIDGLSKAQSADLQALLRGYQEAFRVVGRARACKLSAASQREDELRKAMEARHGPKSGVEWTADVGEILGRNDDAIPCQRIAGDLANLGLPDLPPSLILRENEPLDRVLHEYPAATGSYRVVSRTPAGGGPAEHLIIHRDRIVFRAAQEVTVERQLEVRTPVLLVSTRDQTRKCRDGKPRYDWHAVSLPVAGNSTVATLLGAECTVVYEFHEEWGLGLCAWMAHSGVDERRSKIYAVEDSGRVVPKGELGVGQCPK